jgi:hypothetical protein
VQTGAPLPDMPLWDTTQVDKPLGPPKGEAGRTEKYV